MFFSGSVIYPLMKRFTNYPQVILGLIFNSGIILSNLVITGTIDLKILPFYFSAVLWTIIYDTVYAFQDKKYDVKIGVKSMAIKLGKKSKTILKSLNYMVGGLFIFGGYINALGLPFQIGVILLLHKMIKGLDKMDFNDLEKCKKFFLKNRFNGYFIIFLLTVSKVGSEVF